jgi:ATP adenylyltransferase
MLITELLPSHILVLNKFAIVREHFILATKAFKKQTDLLEAGDLEAAFACLKHWRSHGKELFAFFNGGEHSGASQPHRHIQLLPVESMKEGLKEGTWEPIVDKVTSSPDVELPFTYFSAGLPSNATLEELYGIYISLYSQACRAVGAYNEKNGESNDPGSQSISYNLGITDKSIVLCPRISEGCMISSANDKASAIGPISLNGTLLAGTLLVKSEDEWQALRHDASQLTEVLARIGIPSSRVEKDLD